MFCKIRIDVALRAVENECVQRQTSHIDCDEAAAGHDRCLVEP